MTDQSTINALALALHDAGVVGPYRLIRPNAKPGMVGGYIDPAEVAKWAKAAKKAS